MAQHTKALTQKQKIIIYISAAVIAVIAAAVAVILLIGMINDPPAIIFNSNDSSYISSNFNTSSDLIIPDSTITVVPENNENIDQVISAVDKVEQTPQNSLVVKNTTVDTSRLEKRQVKLDVKYVPQNPELPTGCEITSLTTVLNYYGYNVSKTEMSDNYLEKTIGKIGNFWEVFVGDPRKNGFGCYAKPIVNAANKYLATQNSMFKAVEYSGTEFEDLLAIVENGRPVIIWSTMYGKSAKDLLKPYTTVKWNIDGKNIQWIAPEHCMVLIGYDIDRHVAIMSDPQRGIVEYNLDTVKSRYISLHSQCVVLEQPPVIKGIENGAFYYTTQFVTIENRNIASVTVNGEDVNTQFYLDGNANNMYVIEVTAKSGDVIKYTVYTKPISSLLEPISVLNEYIVTADNIDAINNVKQSLVNLNTDYSPPKESAEIDDAIALCDSFLKQIDTVSTSITKFTKAINKYEETTPQPSDYEDIKKLLNEIDSLLSKNNLTTNQRYEVQKLRGKCLSWVDNTTPIEPDIPIIE